MRLKNTSPLSDELIREIIRFVRPANVSNVSFNVSKARPWGFRGWRCGRRVTVRLAPMPKTGKVQWPPRGGYLGSPPLCSLTEVAVYLLAHELRHCWQSKVRSGHRVWGARGVFSERDADAYAFNALRRWRREHPLGGKRDAA